ncbi:MAG TPA: hypothetical protein VLY63_21325 [Anaerolineae bacterium]|nr:hypothetical protein [Anaerolineae bacterium]
MKVAIQHISLASLGKMGCLLGAVAAFIPSMLCGLLGLGLAGLVLRWLEGWQDLTISILGQEIARIDLVEFFGLVKVLEILQTITAASGWALLLGALILALASSLILAAMILLVGLIYNLVAAGTGGLVVEMKAVSRPEPGPGTGQ